MKHSHSLRSLRRVSISILKRRFLVTEKLVKEREAAAVKARAIAEKAQGEDRALTAAEVKQVTEFVAEIKEFDAQIKAAMDTQALLDSIGSMPEVEKKEADGSDISLGQHFVKGAFGTLGQMKGKPGLNLVLPEFKAAADTHLT